MTKQTTPPPDIEYPSDVPEEIRGTFIAQLDEWRKEQQHRSNVESAASWSEEEIERINTAWNSIADKLGITGELRTINALLQARDLRVVEALRTLNAVIDQGD